MPPLILSHSTYEKPPPPPEWAPAEDEGERTKDASWLDGKDEDELSDLEDDLDDERFLEQYRRERLEQLRASGRASDQQQGSGVSEVPFIRRDEFVKEVTEASNKAWVVVFLFKEG